MSSKVSPNMSQAGSPIVVGVQGQHEYVTDEHCCCCIQTREHGLTIQSKAVVIDTKRGGCFGALPMICCTESSTAIVPYSAIEVVNTSYGGCYNTVCCVGLNTLFLRTGRFKFNVKIRSKEGISSALKSIESFMSGMVDSVFNKSVHQ